MSDKKEKPTRAVPIYRTPETEKSVSSSKPRPPIVIPFQFSPPPQLTFQEQQAAQFQQERQRQERQQRQQEERARRERQKQEERARKEEQARQERIRQYLEQQRQMGIPDTLYVEQAPGQVIKVVRNPNAPDEFWADPRNPNRGIGKLLPVGPGQFRFQLKDGKTFPVSDRPPQTPIIRPPTKSPPPQERQQQRQLQPTTQKPISRPESEFRKPLPKRKERIEPSETAAAKQAQKQPPEKRAALQIKVGEEIAQSAAALEELEWQERRLARELSKPTPILERELEELEEEIRLQESIKEQLEMKRRREEARLRAEKEEKLEKEMAKRQRELAEERKEEIEKLRELEDEKREKIKRLKSELSRADPEERAARAREEIERVRRKREKSELRQRQLSVLSEIQAILNRRLFSSERVRPRSLAELIATFPKTIYSVATKEEGDDVISLQEFALGWPEPMLLHEGEDFERPIDAQEYLLSVNQQKQLVSEFLCGYTDPEGRYIRGYFETQLKMKRGECMANG